MSRPESDRPNLAVVRGRTAIKRLLALTAVEELLVLVDDPADLVPPPAGVVTPRRASEPA